MGYFKPSWQSIQQTTALSKHIVVLEAWSHRGCAPPGERLSQTITIRNEDVDGCIKNKRFPVQCNSGPSTKKTSWAKAEPLQKICQYSGPSTWNESFHLSWNYEGAIPRCSFDQRCMAHLDEIEIQTHSFF